MLKRVVAAVAVVAASNAGAQPADQPARARARLISEQPALIPGSTAWLGVTFDIDKDWHLYWDGTNDTGFPVKLTPTLPDGYKAGSVVWPAPIRHVTDNFLDHVYENRVTLLLPVQVAADAKAGSKATIEVEAEWLVCKQACLPGDTHLSITLPVSATVTPAARPEDALFAEARANTPKPLDKSRPQVSVAWGPDSVRITAPHAKSLAFYPARDSVALTDLRPQGESKSDTLTLHMDKAGPGDRLAGVVEIGPGEHGARTLFAVDSTRPPANSKDAGASNSKQPSGG